MALTIELKKISKQFPKNTKRSSMGLIVKSLLNGRSNSNKFQALKGINLKIQKGEKIGLIGHNGAGKSTLLKIIAGLYKPTVGEVRINGEVNLLAGYGIGMLDELTVTENIFLYAAIYGMSREKIQEKQKEIIEWAGLQEFVNAKLKTLSSGMAMRLAFSTTRYIESEIILLDEALAAGDKNFVEQCKNVFEGYKKSDRTFVVSSHNLGFIREFCTKTIWLNKGGLMAFADTEIVLQRYQEFGAKKPVTAKAKEFVENVV